MSISLVWVSGTTAGQNINKSLARLSSTFRSFLWFPELSLWEKHMEKHLHVKIIETISKESDLKKPGAFSWNACYCFEVATLWDSYIQLQYTILDSTEQLDSPRNLPHEFLRNSSHWAVPSSHSTLVCSFLFHGKRHLVVKNPKVFAAQHGFSWHDVDFQDGWRINVENDTARWLPVLQLAGWWISLHILRSFGMWRYQHSPYWCAQTLPQGPQPHDRTPLNKHDDKKPQGRSAPLFCGWVV